MSSDFIIQVNDVKYFLQKVSMPSFTSLFIFFASSVIRHNCSHWYKLQLILDKMPYLRLQFPLLSKCGLLQRLAAEACDSEKDIIELQDFPGVRGI